MVDERPGPASAPRLHPQLRVAGAVLALSCLVPVETGHDGARFLWQLAPDLGAASTAVLLAPACAGALLIAATFACERAAALAFVALAAIAGVLAVISAGAEALAWDLLPAPEIWSSGPAPGLVAVALAAAALILAPVPESARASILAPVPESARASRALLTAAVPWAAAHLLVPTGGERRLGMLARVLGHVASSSGGGNLVGACLLSTLVLWPALAVAAGWLLVRSPRPRRPALVLGACALPTALLPLVQTSLSNPWGESSSAASTLGGMAVLAATLVVLTVSLAFLASLAPAILWRERRTALLSVAGAALTALAASRLGSPPASAAAFDLGPATPEGDRLFGALLPRWSDARARVDRGTAVAGPDLAVADETLRASARDLDGGLGNAVGTLVTEVGRPGLMERRWYRLVEQINEASRRRALPYYVDPTGLGGTTADPSRRWARVDTYRIEAVRHFTGAARDLITLHVRGLGADRNRAATMGLSRDQQPFAVVVLDELEAYARELEQLAAPPSPRCGEGPVDREAAEDALRDCGEMLAALAHAGELRRTLLAATERHELQHQVDGAYLSGSGWLASRLAWQPPSQRARVRRELSAYLAQMTAGGAAPRLTLLRLLRLALLIRRGPEYPMALLAFEALGDGERVDAEGESVARAYRRLRGLDDDTLRQRAARAWREVYGRELAVLVQLDSP